MADIDDLIDQALAEKVELSNTNEPVSIETVDDSVKSDAPQYRRVKKAEVPPSNPIKEAVIAIAENMRPVEQPVEKKETIEQLKAKLRAKRQGMIQQRTSQKIKDKPGALSPIFYCDTAGCKMVTAGNGMCCTKCRCFYYCSKECQLADWEKHKEMCGKTPTPEGVAKFQVYTKARDAAQTIYEKVKEGDYITVLNEKAETNMPACMFASVAEKSNVLYWKTYLQNSIFTTATPDTIGSLAYKLQAAMDAFPTKKIYMISVLLDRVRDQQTSECILRFFISDCYGGTMESPNNGKITKQVTRYVRKGK